MNNNNNKINNDIQADLVSHAIEKSNELELETDPKTKYDVGVLALKKQLFVYKQLINNENKINFNEIYKNSVKEFQLFINLSPIN